MATPITYNFRIGVMLDETGEPFQRAVEIAQELGAQDAECFLRDAELTEACAARYRGLLDAHGLRMHAVSASPEPFKQIHLDQIALADLPAHQEFVRDLERLRRSIDCAQILGAPFVQVQSFAWPGEYQGGRRVSPTWPQRYAAGGGAISAPELDKLAKAFDIIVDLVERHTIDAVVGMMPWNYTNTSRNFRRIMERVGAPRLKCKWGPADNYNSGELDTVTAGYDNLKPYLTCLHLKDLRILDGPACQSEYVPVGTGDVDYAALFRTFARDRTEIVITVATHFRLGGAPSDAMRLNYRNTLRLAEQALASVAASADAAGGA